MEARSAGGNTCWRPLDLPRVQWARSRGSVRRPAGSGPASQVSLAPIDEHLATKAEIMSRSHDLDGYLAEAPHRFEVLRNARGRSRVDERTHGVDRVAGEEGPGSIL